MTKVTLDLGELVETGKLTAEEASRLEKLGKPSNRIGVFINLFCILGALAVAAGVIALEPSQAMGLMLAMLALGGGAAIFFLAGEQWRILAHGLVIMGAVGMAGWMLWTGKENGISPMVVNLFALGLFTTCAALFRQPFLAALAPLALGAVVGSGTAYWHVNYGIFVREPTTSIAIFTPLAAALFWARDRYGAAWELLLMVAAQVSFFLVNFAFWIGSFWGDHVGELWAAPDSREAVRNWRDNAVFIHEFVFSFGWAAFLIACIWLGTRDHRRFLANTAVVFLAIHAYTQLFETLGAEPWTLVIAGLSMVGVAAGVARFDAWQKARSA